MKTNYILTFIAAGAIGFAASCSGRADSSSDTTESASEASDSTVTRYVEPGLVDISGLEPLAVEDFKVDADAGTYSFVIKPSNTPAGKLKYFITDYSTGARRAVEAEGGRFADIAPASKPAYVYVVTVYDMVDGAVAESASIDVAGVEEFPEKLSVRPSAVDIKIVIDGVLNTGDITKLTDSPLCVTDPEVSLASDPNVKRLSDLIDIYTLGGFSEYTIKDMDFDDTNRVCSLTITVK